MKDAGARQTQSQSMLQNLVSQAETVSTDQVASELLALSDQSAGVLSDNVDAIAADPDQVSSGRLKRFRAK